MGRWSSNPGLSPARPGLLEHPLKENDLLLKSKTRAPGTSIGATRLWVHIRVVAASVESAPSPPVLQTRFCSRSPGSGLLSRAASEGRMKGRGVTRLVCRIPRAGREGRAAPWGPRPAQLAGRHPASASLGATGVLRNSLVRPGSPWPCEPPAVRLATPGTAAGGRKLRPRRSCQRSQIIESTRVCFHAAGMALVKGRGWK